MHKIVTRKSQRRVGEGYWWSVGRRLSRDYLTLALVGIFVAIMLSALFAPVLAPFDPYQVDIASRLQSPSIYSHLLGTDYLGRDILSRLLFGGRVSLAMGTIPVLLALLVGGGLGITAGYTGGRTNVLIMRVMDIFYAFPSILLGVAIAGAMGGGVVSCVLAITVVFIPSICRVAETVTARVRGLDYIDAARASGANSLQIVWTQVLSNIMSPVLVYASSLLGVSIVMASGLSFLGLGVSPPVPDWGLMLSAMRQSIYRNPVECALPGLAIFVTSICFNLVSDGLRAAMDVRS